MKLILQDDDMEIRPIDRSQHRFTLEYCHAIHRYIIYEEIDYIQREKDANSKKT